MKGGLHTGATSKDCNVTGSRGQVDGRASDLTRSTSGSFADSQPSLLFDRPCSNSKSPSPAKSDHPSDAEGASDLDDSEKEAYIASRRRARMDKAAQERRDELEERRLARIKAIDEAEPEVSQAEPSLTKDLFDLMLRTAAALHSAANPRQLEGKILANHGGDPRFSFLRQQATGNIGSVWEKLRQGSALSWADVDPQRNVQATAKQSGLLTEVSIDGELHHRKTQY